MGWGTDFNKDIYLNRKVYNNIDHAEDEYRELEKEVEGCRSQLKMYAAANIRDLQDKDCDNVISWLNIDIDNVLEQYEYALVKMVDLGHYIAYLKERGVRNKKLNKFVKLKISGKNLMVGKRAILIHW